MKVALFLIDKFEDIEALAPIDILRRAGITVDTISITDKNTVNSARNVTVLADKVINNINFEDYEMIILPGGPGTKNYFNSELLIEKLKEFSNNKKLAAICAAPTVLSNIGLLDRKKAICFPACETELINDGAILVENAKVVTDGNITTSRAAGTAIDFALELVKVLLGEEKSIEIKNQIVY